MPATLSTMRHNVAYQAELAKVWPPPIPFEVPVRAKRPPGSEKKEDKDLYREYEVPLGNPMEVDNQAGETGAQKAQTYTRKIKVFEEGTPEEWCIFIEDYYDFLLEAGYQDDSDTQLRVLRGTLKGKAKDVFTLAFNFRVQEAQNAAPTKPAAWALEMAVNDVAKKIFWASVQNSCPKTKGIYEKKSHHGNHGSRKIWGPLD